MTRPVEKFSPGETVTLRSDKSHTPRLWKVLGLDHDGYHQLVRAGRTPTPYTTHKARPDNLKRADTP